jgi:hypothetical protein
MLFDALSLFRWGKRRPAEQLAQTTSKPAESPSVPTGGAERRRAPRRWGDPVQLSIWDGFAGTEPSRGWVVNRSPGGLGISAVQPATEGIVLQVRVAVAPDSMPWVMVVVRGCYPLAGRWILSCEFLQAPSKEILLLFR